MKWNIYSGYAGSKHVLPVQHMAFMLVMTVLLPSLRHVEEWKFRNLNDGRSNNEASHSLSFLSFMSFVIPNLDLKPGEEGREREALPCMLLKIE